MISEINELMKRWIDDVNAVNYATEVMLSVPVAKPRLSLFVGTSMVIQSHGIETRRLIDQT